MRRLLIAAILILLAPCLSFAGTAQVRAMMGMWGGAGGAPVNLVSYERSDYTANTDVTITGGDTFAVTCINGNYPRAEDDPAAGITTTPASYHWVIEITSNGGADVFASIGGTVISDGDYHLVGTYSGDITTGTTGYIRIGANCSESSESTAYKLQLTAN